MTIATLGDYQAAARQTISFVKSTAASQSSSPLWMSASFAQGGLPAAASYAIGNTTTGVVPTNTMTGAPEIAPFSGVGYITRVEYYAGVRSRVVLYDRLFHAGSFSGSVGTTSLSSQPSFSSRVPGGTDFTGLQIWLEQASGTGGAPASNTMRVQYTNQDGTTGRVSGTVNKGNNVAGCLIPVPLASGDCGVQAIENFEVVTASTNCTYNVFVARPLWWGRTDAARMQLPTHWLDVTSAPRVWSDSCLCLMNRFDSGTAAPAIFVDVELASA